MRDDKLLFSLALRSAASFSLASLIRISSSACLFSSSSLCLNAAARASRNHSFSCSQILSHNLSRSSRRLSSSFSISCLCCSNKAFSSASSINLPWGKKQRSKSSSCTAAIRGSSSEVTSMPLSFNKSTFARCMSSSAYAICTWSSSDRGGVGGESKKSCDMDTDVEEDNDEVEGVAEGGSTGGGGALMETGLSSAIPESMLIMLEIDNDFNTHALVC